MDLPIEIFLSFIGFSIVMGIVGIWRKVPFLMFIAGGVITFWAVTTDNIIMGFIEIPANTQITYYDVTSGNTNENLFPTGTEIRGEYLTSSSSMLQGDTIDCIDIPLLKLGSPTGTAIIGVFDGLNTVEASQLKKTFGTQDVTQLTTSAVYHTYCLTAETYTLENNDLVGVMFRTGTGNSTNSILIRSDSNNPFDGTITSFRRWNDPTQVWITSSTIDVTMTMYLSGSDIVEPEPILFTFTEYPKILFALIASMFMIGGALIWKMDDN